MAAPLKLISHKLCPYVQRAVIALTEKGVAFERIDIDLANKPDWFLEDLAARQDAGAAGRRRRDFRIRRDPGISRGNPAQAAASGRCRCPAPSIAPGSNSARPSSTISPGFYAAPDEAIFKAKTVAARAALCAAGGARCGLAMVRRRKLLAGRCGVRPGVSLFRCVRRHRRLRHSRRASRSWRAGARAWRSGRRCAVRSAPTIRRCCADFIEQRKSWLSGLQARAAA